jgi:hypothetical protein
MTGSWSMNYVEVILFHAADPSGLLSDWLWDVPQPLQR